MTLILNPTNGRLGIKLFAFAKTQHGNLILKKKPGKNARLFSFIKYQRLFLLCKIQLLAANKQEANSGFTSLIRKTCLSIWMWRVIEDEMNC